MTEHRCPSCHKLVGLTSEDFAGDVALFCGRCGDSFGSQTAALPRLNCRCGRWLHCGTVERGYLRTPCRRCRTLVELTATGTAWIEPLLARPKRVKSQIRPEDIVALVEERWDLLRNSQAWKRTEIAVGLRFDVFNRDGFRCVYCGRSPRESVLLEADHVVPRSAGGPDTMANLVTACQDCNRGKSAKALDTVGYIHS
jgi:5-methylcytosine-specific restriction endonuclease McrA